MFLRRVEIPSRDGSCLIGQSNCFIHLQVFSSSYDALELNRQNSVQPYGKLELNPGQESVYGNKFAIDQASKNRVYANSHVTGTDNTGDDGPSEIYGNEEVLQSQGQGQGNGKALLGATSGVLSSIKPSFKYQFSDPHTGSPGIRFLLIFLCI